MTDYVYEKGKTTCNMKMIHCKEKIAMFFSEMKTYREKMFPHFIKMYANTE